MRPITEALLQQAAAAFDFGCETSRIERYGAGHINDTFAVWAADESRRFILQRINTDTFTDPVGLMENVCGVTSYLRKQILARGGDAERETLNVILTKDGKPCFMDDEGGAWRAYWFVEGTICLQRWRTKRTSIPRRRPLAASRTSWPDILPPRCTRPSPASTIPPTVCQL